MTEHKTNLINLKKRIGKADLHIHSNFSDGRPTIKAILDYVEKYTDLDVIAITDHDTIRGAEQAVKIASEKKYRFQIIIGEEVTCIEGHILGLFLKKKVDSGEPAHITIQKIHEQGGIAIASHPFMHTRWRDPKIILMDGIGLKTLLEEKDNLDGIEVINATPTLARENIRASLVNKTAVFRSETGSSDAHIVEAIGKGYTLFEGNTAEDLKSAITNNQTQGVAGRWDLLALLKYFFFFIPEGLRMAAITLVHGRLPKREDDIEIPKRQS